MRTSGDALLQEQIDYYRARAGEYDEWFLRQGRYDHGPELNQQWFDEAAQVANALAAFAPTGQVLELACGTGLWTQHIARYAASITAVDSSSEVIEINRQRVNKETVEHIQADLFSWQPTRQYDSVFFSFWLSHVPLERFAPFWNLVLSSLTPGGRVFFIDSLYTEMSTALDHRLEGETATTLSRKLNDGREFNIIKVFYRPETLAAKLAGLGWQMKITATPNYFLYGFGAPAQAGS